MFVQHEKQIEASRDGHDNFSNFMNAVIDERAFNKIVSYIEGGKKDKELELLIGGVAQQKIAFPFAQTLSF